MASVKFGDWKSLYLSPCGSGSTKKSLLRSDLFDWLIPEVGLLYPPPTVIPQWQLVAEAWGLLRDLLTISYTRAGAL